MQRHLLASTSDGNDYVHCAINKPGDPSAIHPYTVLFLTYPANNSEAVILRPVQLAV
jgi:hypothetical protein